MRTSRCGRPAGRTLLAAALLAAATACAGAADDDDAEADTVVWCEQFDVAITASADLDDLDRNDPGDDDALATVQDEMATLSSLEPPAAIATDWETVSGPPPTNETGGFDLGGAFADAGDRIAGWALQECDLSSGGRALLDERRDG